MKLKSVKITKPAKDILDSICRSQGLKKVTFVSEAIQEKAAKEGK